MLNILLAEDNKVDEIATVEYLKNNLNEIDIHVVQSCKGLLEILDGGEVFDIIILDHILEDEQSLKYIDKINNKKNTAQVIVLSGQTDITICIQYLNSGVYAYLNKENNSFKNLVKNINEIIVKKKSSSSSYKNNKLLLYIAIATSVITFVAVCFYVFKK